MVLWEHMVKAGYMVALRFVSVSSKEAAKALELKVLEGAKFACNATDNGGKYAFDALTDSLRLPCVIPYRDPMVNA
jgi:hypothetical protein